MGEVRYIPEKAKTTVETPEQFTITLNREEAQDLFDLIAEANEFNSLDQVYDALLTIL